MIHYLLGIIILLASLLVLIAGIGIIRFKDLYSRMHAVTKVSSLAMIMLILAINLYFWDLLIFIKTSIIFFTVVFLSPIAAHLLAKVTKLGNYNQNNEPL